ncbi:MAG: ribonuclease VapC [Candidatus Bathyarchaeia archaeon]
MGKKVTVLDTSAFLAGFDPFSVSEEQYTTPMVKDEIVGSSIILVRFKTAIESGKLKVKAPSEIFVNKVKETAAVTGDLSFLSDVDLQVLALALELKQAGFSPTIATDDYSIQNVANQLGIEFTSLLTFGIKFRLKWVRYCPACHKKYPANYKFKKCEICGIELKRRPLRKRLVK